jgi:CheY-like chemotaxis protein
MGELPQSNNLQADPDTMLIPVVIISADAMSHQIKKMLKAGARDFLTKPIEIAVFLKMVDKWIEKNRNEKAQNDFWVNDN